MYPYTCHRTTFCWSVAIVLGIRDDCALLQMSEPIEEFQASMLSD